MCFLPIVYAVVCTADDFVIASLCFNFSHYMSLKRRLGNGYKNLWTIILKTAKVVSTPDLLMMLSRNVALAKRVD